MNDEKQTGQLNFNPKKDRGSSEVWGSEINTKRFDGATKVGYVFPELPFQNIGFQLSYSNHDQNSYFGLRNYDIRQESIYSSLSFNSIIGDTRNKFKTGLSFTYDDYKEMVTKNNFDRKEKSIGVFFEYAYDNTENFSLTAGIRIDKHNILKTFITPRLHLRYVPWQKGVLRASIGRGKRSASIFAENQQLFASSRKIKIKNEGGNVYGLHPESAWNYGISFLQGFRLLERKGDITFDFYQTNFVNKVAVDWETPQEVSFYNVNENSIANSFQVEINYEPIKHFNIRTAYKYFDVFTHYVSGNLSKPLQPKHRFFANIGVESNRKDNGSQWKFDVTYNFMGRQRLPNTNNLLANFSEGYSLLNTQITKIFSENFEVYAGGENITNYKQNNPILGVGNPFGANFDSTITYAPIFGSGFYVGFRFKINNKKQ